MLIARDYHSSYLPLSEGFGLDFSTELHCRGINIRHIGLARSLLFRAIPGTVNMYFNESFIRTQRDLRNEVQHPLFTHSLNTFFIMIPLSTYPRTSPFNPPAYPTLLPPILSFYSGGKG